MISKFALFIVSGFLMTISSFADEAASTPPILSFSEFSKKVIAYYPKLKAAHSDVDMALARQMQAKAGFWPSLNLSAGYKISDDPVNVFGMLMRQERYTASDSDLKRQNTPRRHQDFSGGIHIDLPLFDAMQTIYQARSTRELLKAAEADEAFTHMEALLMAQDAYLNAVTLGELSDIVNEVQKNADEDLQKAKDLKEKGMILGADYYSAKVMFADLTRMKNELVRQNKAMMSLLDILMGEPLDATWTLPASVQVPDPSANDIRGLLETALSQRPDLAALDLRLKAIEEEISRARSTSLPDISAYGNATNDRNKIGSVGGNNFTAGVKAELALFDPSRAGRVKESQAKKARLEQDIQLFKDSVRRDIVEETARHDALRENLEVFKAMVDDAGQAVSLMVPLYSEGRKSIADLLETRRTYWQSAQAYHKALMGIWMSEARLLFLSGGLNEEQMNVLAKDGGL